MVTDDESGVGSVECSTTNRETASTGHELSPNLIEEIETLKKKYELPHSHSKIINLRCLHRLSINTAFTFLFFIQSSWWNSGNSKN